MKDDDFQQQVNAVSRRVELWGEALEHAEKIGNFLVGVHESPNPDFKTIPEMVEEAEND